MSRTFYEKMRIVCLEIPEGKVATYGQIALLCGAPRNARQVGDGLKNNLAGSDIPAYRVVNSRGELSGACHFELPDLQRTLLEEENIEVLNPINEAFDPNFHQAVTTQPAAEGEDTDVVVNVLQKGYLLNDRVIRPAMVIVSA